MTVGGEIKGLVRNRAYLSQLISVRLRLSGGTRRLGIVWRHASLSESHYRGSTSDGSQAKRKQAATLNCGCWVICSDLSTAVTGILGALLSPCRLLTSDDRLHIAIFSYPVIH